MLTSPIGDVFGEVGNFPIGQTYSLEQVFLDEHHDSNGYQGYNWHQSAQPELVYDFDDPDPLPPGSEGAYAAGTMPKGDKIYVIYSADGFLEFERIEDLSSTFRGVNGTVGVLEHVIVAGAGYDYDVIYDRLGNKMTFFGDDAGGASRQFWKRESPDDVVLYTGHKTDIVQAASLGYGSDLAVDVQYDADGRRSTFSYTTVSSLNRLSSVKIEVPVSGGSWDEVSRVDYDYYGTGSSNGLPGDLKSVKITRDLSDSGVRLEETTYYRYYTDSMGDGHPHFLRMIVEPEGVRRYDLDNPSTDIDTVADSVVAPYSLAEFEYYPETITSGGTFVDPHNSMRLKKMTTSSGCSCGTDGVHEFRYEKNPAYTDTSAYDTEWAYRTIVSTPSGLWNTYYMDETLAQLSHVGTVGDPATATDVWATQIVRDSNGYISAIHSPENITAYTHGSTDPSATVATSFTASTSSGLVTTFERFGADESSTPDAALNYIKTVWHQKGTSGDRYLDVEYEMAAQVETVAGAELTRTFVTEVRPYEDEYDEDDYDNAVAPASDLTTTYYRTFSSSTSVVLETLVEESPTPSASNNGSATASVSRTYFKPDGTPWLIGHADGTWDYMEFTRGALTLLIEDVRSSNPALTGLTLPSGVGPDGLQRTTRWTIDDLRRVTFREEWDGRLSYSYYTKLANGRGVTVQFPLVEPALDGSSDPDYSQAPAAFSGPAYFAVRNLAGQAEEFGSVTISGGQTTIAQADLVDETEASALDAFELSGSTGLGDLGSLSRMVLNDGGWMVEESHAYFDIPAPGAGFGTEGTHFDATHYEYDASGQLARVEGPTGTVVTYEYDEWNLLVAERMGTDDSGSGNMVLLKEYEYDGGSAGGNGYLTKITRHEDSSTSHDVEIQNDYRGRAIIIENPEAPHLLAKLDNLGRPVAIAEYSSASSLSLTDDPTTTTSSRWHDPQERVHLV